MLPLGIYAWFVYELPLKERLQLISRTGFSTTCIWFGHEEAMVKDGQADRIPFLVHNAGLALENVHADFWHSNYLWSESPDECSIIRRELTDTLSFCGTHRIPIMVMHLSAGQTPPPPTPQGLALINDLVRLAEDQSVTIALENSEDYGNHYLDFVFSNIESPNLGFCYDSSHDFIAREFRGQALERWGHRLVTTHLSDNHGVNDDHLLPTRGSIDWPELMKHFPEKYQGTLMLEVDGPDANKGFTLEAFLKEAFLQAGRLRQMLG
jgi:sugar phosphate isomerase/epimerase